MVPPTAHSPPFRLPVGIGHRVKSLTNPDKRVVILKDYARAHFPATDVLQVWMGEGEGGGGGGRGTAPPL